VIHPKTGGEFLLFSISITHSKRARRGQPDDAHIYELPSHGLVAVDGKGIRSGMQ
jgi:hypothetical protein